MLVALWFVLHTAASRASSELRSELEVLSREGEHRESKGSELDVCQEKRGGGGPQKLVSSV